MKIARLDQEVDGQRTTLLCAFGDDLDSGRAVIGSVELLTFQAGHARKIEPRRSACIRMLFVHRGFRMQGVGRELVQEAIELSRSLGCETLGLSLAADNYSGAQFYKKLGFTFAYEYDDGSFIVTKTLRESAKSADEKS